MPPTQRHISSLASCEAASSIKENQTRTVKQVSATRPGADPAAGHLHTNNNYLVRGNISRQFCTNLPIADNTLENKKLMKELLSFVGKFTMKLGRKKLSPYKIQCICYCSALAYCKTEWKTVIFDLDTFLTPKLSFQAEWMAPFNLPCSSALESNPPF